MWKSVSECIGGDTNSSHAGSHLTVGLRMGAEVKVLCGCAVIVKNALLWLYSVHACVPIWTVRF